MSRALPHSRLVNDFHPIGGRNTSTDQQAAVRKWRHSSSNRYLGIEDSDDRAMVKIVIAQRVRKTIVSSLTASVDQRETMEAISYNCWECLAVSVPVYIGSGWRNICPILLVDSCTMMWSKYSSTAHALLMNARPCRYLFATSCWRRSLSGRCSLWRWRWMR